MDTQPQQTPPIVPQQRPAQPSRTRRIVLIVVGLMILAAIAFLLRRFWIPAEEVALERPLDLPVEEPDVGTMEEIADLMEGKPLPPEFPMKLPPFDEDDHIYGERFADYSIVEYSNYGNRYATLLHPDLRAFVDGSNGTANWVVRHYPVTIADYTPAQAAECAYFGGGHEAFWSYFAQVFPATNTSKEALIDIAAAQGLNRDAFANCLEKDFTRDHVLIDLQDGRLDAKVRVSPSYVVVNNLTGELRLVEGVNTIEYLQEVLESVR